MTLKERDDISQVLSCIKEARARTLALQAVEPSTLSELLFHLDCCAVATMRMQAESWLEVDDSPKQRNSTSNDH